MALAPGSRLGPYEILAPLGAGGMGEVYRARDPKLDRDVAVKVLPEEFFEDRDRVARFEREAKSLAALNHPGIAAVYFFEAVSGRHILVMELVEGQGLDARIASGAIPLEEALPIARQIAEALEAAHERGIVHRDLKPANVMVSPDGRVKLLDFGLAKALEGDPASSSAPQITQSPTLTARATAAGMILGTAAYMSPEQARGRTVDKRTDIWAFGAVLWEMLTGHRLFEGDTVSDVLAAVLRADVDWETLPAGTPRSVRRLLGRCLERDPKRRQRDVGEARIVLQDAVDGDSPEEAGVVPVELSARARRLAVAVRVLAGLALLAIGASAGWLYARRAREGGTAAAAGAPAANEIVKTSILPPSGVQLGRAIALSSDGTQLAFVAARRGEKPRLWVRRLDSLEARPLEGTENGNHPFWSPDGQFLGFFADNNLKIVPAGGGPVRLLASAISDLGGAWNAAGTILFAAAPEGRIYRVPAAGGDVVRVTGPAAITQSNPVFLPNNRHFLYSLLRGGGVMVGDLSTGKSQSLLAGAGNAQFAPPDQVLYTTSGGLFARRLDLKTLKLDGEPRAIVHVATPGGSAIYSVSSTGRLAYAPSPQGNRELLWLDRHGARAGTLRIPENASLWLYRISHNGRFVALSGFGLWVHGMERGISQRLPVSSFVQLSPVWSPDDRRIAYGAPATRTSLVYELHVIGADGRGDERLLESDSDLLPLSWSPDGKSILCRSYDVKTGRYDLRLVDVDGRRVSPWLAVDGDLRTADISPDGRWAAYSSTETGASEIYVRAFPKPGVMVRVSTAGGQEPRWRSDGKELLYLDNDGDLVAVEVTTEGETPRFGNPTNLVPDFRPDALFGQGTYYDVAPNGQRFLTLGKPPEEPSCVLIQNWTAGLAKPSAGEKP